MAVPVNRAVFYLFIWHIISGCFEPASRDNPLDPQGTMFSPRGMIKGHVSAYYQTDKPVPGAAVYLFPAGGYQISTADGYFEFGALKSGVYKLKAVQDGYRSDSLEVAINNDIQNIQLQLNGIPVVRRVSLQTHHISRWWPSDDLYYLTVVAEVDDPDGATDIDSVWAELPAGANSVPLIRTGQNGVYSGAVSDQQLSAPGLYFLQGKPIIVYCRDLLTNTGESEKVYIPRIIEQTPVLIYPTDLAAVTGMPIVFVWEPLYIAFPVTYKLEIYQINLGVYNKIHEFSGLPPETTDFAFTGSLEQGDYFWVLYIVDEFGDSSRSKEGAFRVN